MKILDSKEGLTLIETLIALTLVILLTTAFAGAIIIGLQSETTSDNLDYSSNLSASIFDFLLTENNYQDIISIFKKNDIKFIYKNYLLGDEESFYNDLHNLNIDKNKSKDQKIEEKFKKIITSFENIPSYNLLTEESEIIIDKIITNQNSDDPLVLYKVKLNIISNGPKNKENYIITTILGDTIEQN